MAFLVRGFPLHHSLNRFEIHHDACRKRQQSADDIKQHSDEDARLVRDLANDQRGWNRHRGVAAIERPLNQAALSVADQKNLLERTDQVTGHVVGKPPQRKQRGHEDQWIETLSRPDAR